MNLHTTFFLGIFLLGVDLNGQSNQVYRTTQKVVLSQEQMTIVNKDSLIYEKCQYFNEPSFETENSTKVTTIFYLNDDGSIIVEEEDRGGPDRRSLKIYDNANNLSIHLYDYERKEGGMREQRPSRSAFSGFVWNSISKKELVNGWNTEVAIGTKTSYAGEETLTVWYSQELELPRPFIARLLPDFEATGVPVQLQQRSETQCYSTQMKVILEGQEKTQQEFDLSGWSIEDETIREAYSYEEIQTEEVTYEEEYTEEGYNDLKEESATIVVDDAEYTVGYGVRWMSIPFDKTTGEASYDLNSEADLLSFNGSLADRELSLSYPDSLFLFIDEYMEEKSVWLASEEFESYRYYPETVPIYSSSQIAVRVTPVLQLFDDDFLINFSDNQRELESNGTRINCGERYYMNEENRAIHAYRYFFKVKEEAYLVDGFQELGSNYEDVFFQIVESMLR